MRRPARALTLAAVLALAAPSFGWDLSLHAGLSNRSGPDLAPALGAWGSASAQIGASVGEAGYVSADVVVLADPLSGSSSALGDLMASLSGDAGSLGLMASYKVSGLQFEVFGSTSMPLVGDVVTLDTSVGVKTDLKGASAFVAVGPQAYLPLENPVMLGLTLRQDAVTAGFEGRAYTGLATMELEVTASLFLAGDLSVSGGAGYTLDDSGGQFSSYPYASLSLGWSHGY